MAQWNLHLVGRDNEETLQSLVADFVSSLESAGHKLEAAVLTSDNGQTDVPLTPPEPDTPPPADVPVDTPPEPLAQTT
jgi:hypothetical protein